MAQNLEYGIRITADGSVVVSEAGKAKQALKRIGAEAEKSSAVASKFGLAVGAAAAAGAAAFTGLIKRTVDTAAAFDDLSESTGSTVENLSSLANSMAVSGVDMGTFTSLMNKLAVGLSGVDDEGGKAGKALAALGVQSKDPATAMKELAVSLDKYADGANKAALLTAIFGRGAAQYAGVLKDLARDTEMAATVTTDFAAEAENLQKEMARARIEVEALAVSIAGPLTTAVSSFLKMTRESGWSGFFAWLGLSSEDQANADQALAETQDKIARLQKMREELSIDTITNKVNNLLFGDIADIDKQLAVLQARASMLQSIANATTSYITGLNGDNRPDAPKPPSAEHTTKVKKAADTWNEMAAAVRRAYENALNWELAGQKIEDQLNAISAAYAEAYVKERDAYEAQLDKSQEAMRGLVVTMEQEVELLGLSNSQRRLAIALRELEASGIERESAEYAQLEERIRAAIGAEETYAVAESWAQVSASIRDDLTDAFMRAAASGRDFFKSLAASLVNMFSNLVLRPIIQGIVAPVAGSITGALGFSGNAAASGGGSLGGGSLGGIGNLGSLFGGFGSLGSGASISIGNIGSLGFLEGSLANFANIGGQLASGASGIMPAIGMAMPYIAAVAGIGMLVKGILDSNRGGPKSGGFAASGLVGALSNSDGGRWFTPNSADSAMQDLTKGLMTSYAQIIASLGGSGRAGFALGYDTDPQGTAPNRLHAGAFVGGQSVYDAALGDLGRDDAALQAALELESKRALLAALQASELPQQIAAVFNSVAASGASSETIDNLLAFGSAMKTVVDSIGGSVVDDARLAWERSQRSSVEVLRDMGAEVIRLANNMDGSTASMQALASATGDYRAAVVQTLVAIKQIEQDVAAMFGATRNSLEEFGLTPEELYDRYRRDADEAAALLASATDPASVQKLSERINNDINAAFNALGDDGKGQQRDPLLTYLNGIDALAASKLAALSASIGSSTTDPFAAANSALDGAAGKFAAAAGVQADAASTLERAAAKIDAAASRFETAVSTPMQAYVVANEVG